MKHRFLKTLCLCAFVPLCLSVSVAEATTVKISGRQLLVDGSPFAVKGVNYSPTPVGKNPDNFSWWSDQNVYKTDFPLIASMGANVIRTFDARSATKAALDFAGENGLYVIMGFPVSTTVDLSDSSTRQTIRNDFLSMVSQWKSHPAVLAWSLGNEQNLNNGNNSVWYTLVSSCALAAHSLEGADFHPVMTVEGGFLGNIGNSAKNADDVSLANLDIWGANLYLGPDFLNAFAIYKTKSSKPLLVTEFGWDAFDESSASENQITQSTTLKSQWNDIKHNLNASDSQKVCVGGIVFEWSDEWWKGKKSVFGDGGSLGNFGHDTANDWTNPAYPAQIIQEEWWGIVSITTGTNAKSLRRAFSTLKDEWAPSPVIAPGVFAGEVRNFPNPLRLGSNTAIQFSLQNPGSITAEIVDVLGRKVRTLKDAVLLANNTFSYTWNGRDEDNNEVSTGLYICRVEVNTSERREVKTRRIVVVR